MVLAIFYTWLFNHTRGAVSVAILFHAIGNATAAAVPTWATEGGRWIGFAVQIVFAAAILLIWGPRHLSRSPAAGMDGRHVSGLKRPGPRAMVGAPDRDDTP
jgi:hypothetical protein